MIRIVIEVPSMRGDGSGEDTSTPMAERPPESPFGDLHSDHGVSSPSRAIQALSFDLPQETGLPHTPTTGVTLPYTGGADFAYSLYDTERGVAYLRVDRMTNYREACEQGNGSPERCASIPSATEIFRVLVIDMKAAGAGHGSHARRLGANGREDLGKG